MVLPDYKGNSIVNLVASMTSAMGDRPMYRPVPYIDSSEIGRSKNIIFILIDGLGYNFLLRNGQGSILHENLRGRLTSVFPSTTSACVNTFNTGLAPKQHAITGWYMFLKETGHVAAVLPYTPRGIPFPYSMAGVEPEMLFDQVPIYKKIDRKSYFIIREDLVDSDFNRAANEGSERVSYKFQSLRGMFQKIRSVVESSNRRKFIYAYWPELDTLCHHFGTRSPEATSHLSKIMKVMAPFVRSLKDSTVIITADHGQIDCEEARTIRMSDHPRLLSTLTLPICGEARAPYFYVRPSRTQEFEACVRANFSHACDMYRSEEIVRKGYFGLYRESPKLFDRIGDYILIMKENWIIKHVLAQEAEPRHIGVHGGVSEDEMYVPLIMIRKGK